MVPVSYTHLDVYKRQLKVCRGLENQGIANILVTKDIVVRIKAQMMGLRAEDFTTEQVPESRSQYTGRAEVYVADEKLEQFKEDGLFPEDLYLTCLLYTSPRNMKRKS